MRRCPLRQYPPPGRYLFAYNVAMTLSGYFRFRLRTLLIAMGLASILLGAAAYIATDRSVAWRMGESRGVVVKLSIPRRVRIAERPVLSVVVRNSSKGPICVGDNGYVPDCRAILINRATGKRCPFTRSGNNTINGDPPGGRSQYGIGKIEAGKSRDWNSLDLAMCYDLEPGQYMMEMTFDVDKRGPQPFTVSVKDLRFELCK